MKMKSILALDQGTTSSRAILFDERGAIAKVAQKEFRQIYPQPGWVEHDPNEIWSTQHEVMTQLPKPHAIGITNQRETTILWDRNTGEPIALDVSGVPWLHELQRRGHALRLVRTGLVLDPYFSGTKIRWLLDNAGGKNLAFGTVDTWLIWKLTSGRVHATDITNASRTLLFNIHTNQWDDDLLKILKIPREILPTVVRSSEVVGETDDGVPIAGIAGDQQAALFGQACHRPGMAKNTYGTGCFIVMNTGDRVIESKHGLLATSAVNAYALEGSVFIAGAAIQWLRDNLHMIKTSADVEALAAEDSGGVIFIPAFTGLGAPHWDPHARAAILGMTRGSTRCDAQRLRPRAEGAASRWRRVAQQSVDADPGRRRGCASRESRYVRSDRTRRRVSRRAGGRSLDRGADRQPVEGRSCIRAASGSHRSQRALAPRISGGDGGLRAVAWPALQTPFTLYFSSPRRSRSLSRRTRRAAIRRRRADGAESPPAPG